MSACFAKLEIFFHVQPSTNTHSKLSPTLARNWLIAVRFRVHQVPVSYLRLKWMSNEKSEIVLWHYVVLWETLNSYLYLATDNTRGRCKMYTFRNQGGGGFTILVSGIKQEEDLVSVYSTANINLETSRNPQSGRVCFSSSHSQYRIWERTNKHYQRKRQD